MSRPKIYLSPPHMGGLEQQYVNDAFASNWLAPLGPHVDAFEQELCDFTGAGHCVALSSGTAAIHLALILAGVQKGDEVICQSLTFSASANPIVYLGATPVFVDSEPHTWNIDPDTLEEAIKARLRLGKKVKAIMAVHLYGMPALLEEILHIGEKFAIPVIEDAAEAMGARYQGRHLGTAGQFGIFSFNGNKIITTTGGGALVCPDKKLIDKARFLATQARDEAPHYEHSQLGYNYRMSNVLAAIGRGQLKVLPERVAKRRNNFEQYANYFERLKEAGFDIKMTLEPENALSNRWLTTILIGPSSNKGITREKVRLHMIEANIEARPVWKPMHLQPFYKDAPFYGNGIAEKIFKEGLCLPSGSSLTENDFETIFQTLDMPFRTNA